MPDRPGFLSFANIVSVIALFIALGGSAYAVQAAKKNSVTSKSIRNGAVKSVDIGNGQVRSADIGDGSVGSADVADGSISATDIDVASLGDPTSGRTSSFRGACIQNVETYQPCSGTEINLARPARIFATADGSADSGAASVPVGVNTCQLAVDGAAFTGGFVIAADFSPGEAFSFAGVTEQLAPGQHTVRLECKGNGTLPGPRIFEPSITTLVIGPD